jgi:chloride channel 3/4/5
VRRVSPTAKCYFTSPDQDPPFHRPLSIPVLESTTPFESVTSLDFGEYVDATPLSVHPNLPLETVMEMFKKLGPRVILVELRGKIVGLVSVKDVLKYQFKVESEEHPRAERDEGGEERLWGWIQNIGDLVRGCGGRRGRVVIGSVMGEEDEVELVDHVRR